MAATTILAQIPLYDGNSYIGMAFRYEGGFTHSLLRHGAPGFTCLQGAIIDFRRTYDSLPSKVRGGGPARKCAFVYCDTPA